MDKWGPSSCCPSMGEPQGVVFKRIVVVFEVMLTRATSG